MFGSDILEIAIGIIFIYFILSLIASIVTEFIGNTIMKLRATTLKEGISVLLSDRDWSNFATAFYEHPLIKSLSHREEALPSTIEKDTFATVILDIIATANDTLSIEQVDQLIAMIQATPTQLMNDALKTQLIAILRGVKRIDEAKIKIEEWYEAQMARVSGWYKRKVQYITIAIAVVIVFASNADTIMIFNQLSQDPTAREALIVAATNITENPPEQASGTTIPDNVSGTASEIPTDFQQTVSDIEFLTKELRQFSLIGWSTEDDSARKFPTDINALLSKIVGLALTAGAVSLGAPFWFDLLNKVVDLKTGGKKSDEDDIPKVAIGEIDTSIEVSADN